MFDSDSETSSTVTVDDRTPLLGPCFAADLDPPVAFSPGPQSLHGPGSEPESADGLRHKTCPGCSTTAARNLVVCIDGTSNQFSTKNTNVVELYSRLVKDEHQLTFYKSGIGTYAKPSWRSLSYFKQVVANTLDLAFAVRFEKIIISAYAWLVDNYQPGDRIFLFGFSRGAYQVRALAAMIDIVGLLHKGNNDQIPFAYELYAASGHRKKHLGAEAVEKAAIDVRPWPERISRAWRTSSSNEKSDRLPAFPWPAPRRARGTQRPDGGASVKEDTKMQVQFKKAFSRRDIRVHFVGAWDTVSSVGLIRDKTLPATTDGMHSVCFFRHALALHEFRVKFLPEYVNGSSGPTWKNTLPLCGEQHTKEVWFTGSHSDIGGGSTANTSLDKFGPALRWMSWEAAAAGLRLVESPNSWEPISVSKSMTAIWSLVECLPIRHLTHDTDRKGPAFTWKPHLFARRKIQPHQSIHQSVHEECLDFEEPEDVRQESDAYLVLRPQDEVLRTGRILNSQSSQSLQQLASSANGIKSLGSLNIMRYIYDIARLCHDRPDIRTQILDDLQALHGAYLKGLFRIKGTLSDDADVPEAPASVTFAFHMCGHAGLVSSVAFLSSTCVVSGSWDKTVRIWDVATGEMTLGIPLSGHSGDINCVAVAKGLIASASDDSAIRLWTSDSSGAVQAGNILQDKTMWRVLSIAFSPDGSHLVSGSGDGAIRVWDTAKGVRVGEPLKGHIDCVRSVALSSDCTQIVSGSDDHTVRLWEWSNYGASFQPYSGSLHGHTKHVFSVAFSPDARLIVSGSRDTTVRLWDAITHTAKFTMQGHTHWVNSVAFAPSGAHVVSGSDDWTVRTWDARTGSAIRVLRGHTDFVLSVSFSPDGTRIASGSLDKTVRVWEFVPALVESHDDDARDTPMWDI